jgi:hypothetical protein
VNDPIQNHPRQRNTVGNRCVNLGDHLVMSSLASRTAAMTTYNQPIMDVNEFRTAVRNLATFAEDLWIQNEFYKGYILQVNQIDPERLEFLADTALQVQDVRESVRKLFAPIYTALDSTESADLIQELLNKQVPPGKPN